MNAINRTHSIPSSFSKMEMLVDEIPCIGRIMIHMAETPHEIEGRELAWIGSQLVSIGRELCDLWTEAHREFKGGAS